MNQAIDLYCERLDPGLWAEPVNALSNLAFFLAAIWLQRRLEKPRWSALLASVGVGSLLFHTLAVRWAMVADVVPIVLLIAGAAHRALRHHLGWSWPGIGGAALLLGGVGALLWVVVPAPQERGAAYVPAVLALWGVWASLRHQGHAGARAMGVAALAITLAFGARSLDGPLCGLLPLGTHWIWHLANSVGLAWLLVAVVPTLESRS